MFVSVCTGLSPAAAASAAAVVSPAGPAAAAPQTPWRETATGAPPGLQSSELWKLHQPSPSTGRPPWVSRQMCSLWLESGN